VKKGSCGAHVIVVEEMSQLNTYLWNDLAKVALKGVQFVLLGDWAQMDAVLDTWGGMAVKDGTLEKSDLMHELVGGHRLTLTRNRRSDPPLFDFYTGLRCGTPEARDLREALFEARALFPVTEQSAEYTLCISHATRVEINRVRNGKLKPKRAVLYKYTGEDDKQQSMYIWPGMQLIGAGGKCKKCVLHYVDQVNEEGLLVHYKVKDDEGVETEVPVKLSQATAVKCLRPAWALTFASVQGLTLRGRVRLLDTDHSHFVLKHLYVGSSRATAASLLEVC
jgi:hypothetical protein